jgi:hypothetical protein
MVVTFVGPTHLFGSSGGHLVRGGNVFFTIIMVITIITTISIMTIIVNNSSITIITNTTILNSWVFRVQST